jgi:REP element-mobilizing transposase RayT
MYFVTIDVQDKLKLFWNKKEMNDAGKMIKELICEMPIYYKGIYIVEFVVMPDHVHLIIEINNNGRIWESARTQDNNVGADPCICPENIKKYSLSEIIQRFKILSTNKYIFGVKNNNWLHFYGKLWQRNYYERIIRNDNELYNVRRYIKNNPSCEGL